MKPVKDPFITTIRGLKETSGTKTYETVRKIQDKLFYYGIVSEVEQQFLNRFGKTDQKELAK